MVLGATVVIAAFTVWYTASFSGDALFRLGMHSEVAAFGLFASATLLLFSQGRTWPRLPALTYVGLLALALALYWWKVPPMVKSLAGVGTLALTVNLLFNAPPSVHAALSFRPLRKLGLWSFSIYVWQQPFYLLSSHHGMHPALGVTLAMMCGIGSFYLIENPARSWLNRRWSPDARVVQPVQVGVA